MKNITRGICKMLVVVSAVIMVSSSCFAVVTVTTSIEETPCGKNFMRAPWKIFPAKPGTQYTFKTIGIIEELEKNKPVIQPVEKDAATNTTRMRSNSGGPLPAHATLICITQGGKAEDISVSGTSKSCEMNVGMKIKLNSPNSEDATRFRLQGELTTTTITDDAALQREAMLKEMAELEAKAVEQEAKVAAKKQEVAAIKEQIARIDAENAEIDAENAQLDREIQRGLAEHEEAVRVIEARFGINHNRTQTNPQGGMILDMRNTGATPANPDGSRGKKKVLEVKAKEKGCIIS